MLPAETNVDPWALVIDPALQPLLRVGDRDGVLLVMDSLLEALRDVGVHEAVSLRWFHAPSAPSESGHGGNFARLISEPLTAPVGARSVA
jgi:hypothetical protein